MTSDRGKRVLAYHKDKLGKPIKARVMSLVISYDFASAIDHKREGNQHDLVKLKDFFSACSDCDFRCTSPSAQDMRNKRTLSADGIKQIFGADEPPTLFFLFILSHGSEQGQILTDTRIGEDFDSFSTDNVLLALKNNIFLRNAVKLIFFGPCRGPHKEMCSTPMKGYDEQTEVNKYATRVEFLPEQDNFAIFYSTVESTRAVRLTQDGTVMVNSFVSKMNNIKTVPNIIELFTEITKHISKSNPQTPQFTVFPHLATYFCRWMPENTSDAIGTNGIDYFKLSHGPFRRSLIFSDGTSNDMTAKFQTSLNTLGFQVHCNQLNLLMQTARNISRLEMRNDEAWLLIFIFATIKKTDQDGLDELGIAAADADVITPMREIVQLFTGANCSSYAAKPKIFFFLDANNKSFDSFPINVHTQQDIRESINNHSGIVICSSADQDFIDKLPSELNRMIDEKMSLQQVVFNLMETGKSRYLTRLWSTSPEKICILEYKICPVHPELLCEGATMTIANIAKQIKTQSNRITIVAAASEEEKHAASIELYSHSVIEYPVPEEMVLYLKTSDALNKTELEKFKNIESKCKISAEAESTLHILVVVEYSGIELNAYLEDFLNLLIRYDGKVVIVTLEKEGKSLADKVRDLLQKYDKEELKKERAKERDILEKKNPTTFEGCNYESINLILRTDIITAVENLPTGACVQELSTSNENILFAKLLSNSIPGLCYFMFSDFLSVEIGIRQKWVNRNPHITIVFIANEDEDISDTINLGVCKWFVLKACAKNTSNKITVVCSMCFSEGINISDKNLKYLSTHIAHQTRAPLKNVLLRFLHRILPPNTLRQHRQQHSPAASRTFFHTLTPEIESSDQSKGEEITSSNSTQYARRKKLRILRLSETPCYAPRWYKNLYNNAARSIQQSVQFRSYRRENLLKHSTERILGDFWAGRQVTALCPCHHRFAQGESPEWRTCPAERESRLRRCTVHRPQIAPSLDPVVAKPRGQLFIKFVWIINFGLIISFCWKFIHYCFIGFIYNLSSQFFIE